MDTIMQRIVQCIGPKHGATKELAEHLGIHPNVITNWKNGSLRSYTKYLDEIASFYHVSREWLEGKTEQKEKAPGPEGERRIALDDFTYAMYEEGKELTEENKKKLLEMAQFFRQQQEKEG